MSTLVLNYGMESSFYGAVKSASSALNQRVDDYVNIEQRVRSIRSTTDNCSQCAGYVRKKYQQIQEKTNQLHVLNGSVERFLDSARETDKRVASRIKRDTKTFQKRTGIGKRSKSLWASICGGIGDLSKELGDILGQAVEAVKQFYEDNKYWIGIAVDILAIAAAISTGGIVGVFFAVDALSEFVYDLEAAYQYYVEHDEVAAEQLSAKGGKDAFTFVGNQIDSVLGTDCIGGLLGIAYTGISIAAAGYNLCKSGSQVLKDLKLNKVKIRSPFSLKGGKFKVRSPFHGNFKLGTHFTPDKIGKATRNLIGAKAVQQKDVVKMAYRMNKYGLKNIKTCFTIAETYFDLKRLKKGYDGVKKIVEGIGRIKKGENPFKNLQESVDSFYEQSKLVSSGGVV